MKPEERFGKQLIFNYISEQIEYNRTRFSEMGKDYIESAKDFFDNITYALESIINPKQEYFLIENLPKLHEVIVGKKEFSKRSINKAVKKLTEHKKQLDNLVENPEEFYQSKDASELSNLCRNMGYLYEPKVITIF